MPLIAHAVERNSAECYLDAIQRASKLPSSDALIDENFPRQVDVAIHDDHPSNGKTERAWSNSHPNRSTLDLLCDAHKKCTVSTKTFDLWKSLPTIIIRLAMSVRGAGMTQLRRALREETRDSIKFYTGAPPIFDN